MFAPMQMFYTIGQCARLAVSSEENIERAIRTGWLHAFNIAGARWVRGECLAAYIEGVNCVHLNLEADIRRHHEQVIYDARHKPPVGRAPVSV